MTSSALGILRIDWNMELIVFLMTIDNRDQIENNTWARGDMEFLSGIFTSERGERVRYRAGGSVSIVFPYSPTVNSVTSHSNRSKFGLAWLV